MGMVSHSVEFKGGKYRFTAVSFVIISSWIVASASVEQAIDNSPIINKNIRVLFFITMDLVLDTDLPQCFNVYIKEIV
jgi:hypothetical protein